ncbi:CsbD family protein [Pseudochrobactrum sp. MP213Fo]|uniref:CsbD family protein n=1 Tax=Pseudochrobactrum sp. MP213Fo TaxID=3022250 RepID=UPI003BA10C63
MEWNEIKTDWPRYKVNIREQWGNLSAEEVDEIAGEKHTLEKKLQERYSLTPEQVREQINDWYRKIIRNI